MESKTESDRNEMKNERVPILDVDPEIPDQKYPVLSFMFPNDVVQKKESFFVQEFWKTLSKSPQFRLLKEYANNETIPTEVRESLQMIVELPMAEQYETFLSKNYEKLHEVYRKRTNNLADTYGVMFRGAFPTLEQAKAHTDKLCEREKTFHKFVGLQGHWLPLDSTAADFIGDQKYTNENLNNLMSDFQKQQKKKDEHYQQETQRRIKLAREEGARGRNEAGSVPGQSVTSGVEDVLAHRPVLEIQSVDNDEQENA